MSLDRTEDGQRPDREPTLDNPTGNTRGRNLDDALRRALDEVDVLVPALMAQHHVPGVVIGVFHSGRSEVRCFGTLAIDDLRPVDPSTLFSVQSVSKLFTATALMVLVDRGLLDLDRPIVEYLPTFTVHSAFEVCPERQMTLRHLLSHTAGFTHEAPVGSNYDLLNASFSEHCASITGTWLRGPVGHHCEYSNLGVDLAGLIVELQTGLPFARAVRELLFEPLGLTHSTFDADEIATAASRAVGHEPGFASVPLAIPMVPSGGLYTNVVDALGLAAAHRQRCSGLLSGSTYEQMSAIPFPAPLQQFGYALGVHHQHRGGGVPVSGHAGNGFGFHADLAWSDPGQFDVVVLTNSGEPGIKWRVGDAIIKHLGLPQPQPRLESRGSDNRRAAGTAARPGVTTPGHSHLWPELADTDDFTGRYFSREGSALVNAEPGEDRHDRYDDANRTSARGLRLLLRIGDQHESLAHVYGDTFAGPTLDVEFLRAADQQVRYMRRLHDGVTFYRDLPNAGSGTGSGTGKARPVELVERSFALLQWGQPVAEVSRSHSSSRTDDHALLRVTWAGEEPEELTLSQVTDRIYITCTGETLNLTVPETPTYASIPLLPVQSDL